MRDVSKLGTKFFVLFISLVLISGCKQGNGQGVAEVDPSDSVTRQLLEIDPNTVQFNSQIADGSPFENVKLARPLPKRQQDYNVKFMGEPFPAGVTNAWAAVMKQDADPEDYFLGIRLKPQGGEYTFNVHNLIGNSDIKLFFIYFYVDNDNNSPEFMSLDTSERSGWYIDAIGVHKGSHAENFRYERQLKNLLLQPSQWAFVFPSKKRG